MIFILGYIKIFYFKVFFGFFIFRDFSEISLIQKAVGKGLLLQPPKPQHVAHLEITYYGVYHARHQLGASGLGVTTQVGKEVIMVIYP